MSKTAIIIGATGLTGGLLLNKLIADDRYDTIKLFSRSSVNNNSKKIKEYWILNTSLFFFYKLIHYSLHKKSIPPPATTNPI